MKVLILRGPSGAGKTTLARRVADLSDSVIKGVLSADAGFYSGGTQFNLLDTSKDAKYSYDVRKLGEYHYRALGEFMELAAAGASTLVVDSTSIRTWEWYPFFLHAHALTTAKPMHISVLSVVPETVSDIKLCWERGTHGVSLAKVAEQACSMEPAEPVLTPYINSGSLVFCRTVATVDSIKLTTSDDLVRLFPFSHAPRETCES